jgi:hypothetical protein
MLIKLAADGEQKTIALEVLKGMIDVSLATF